MREKKTFRTASEPSQAGRGPDVIIEATGNPEVLKGCFNLLRHHGTLVVAGIFHETAGVDLLSVVRNENTIIGFFVISARAMPTPPIW